MRFVLPLLATFFISSAAFGQSTTWSSSNPAGETYAQDWVGITSTSSRRVVISQQNVFVSSDSGATWARKTWLDQGESSSLALTDVDGSSDGSTLILCQGFAGKVRLSKDSGDTWASVASRGTKNWRFVTSSADGKTLTAYNGLKLCVSADSGGTWAEKGLSKIASASNLWTPWMAVDAADDGKTLIVATSKNLYVTNNAGDSWTGAGNPGDLGESQWRSVAINQDGTRIVAGTQGGKVYLGTKSSGSWTWTSTSFTGTWVVACSGDGRSIAAADYSSGREKGSIQLSSDAGATWSVQTPKGFWTCIGCTPDGKFMAGALGELIHRTN
jgi:photosystem II stability/assembly factor-like uncharacterized protein